MPTSIGVQFRDFHTAIHHVSIFKTKTRANNFLRDLKDLEDSSISGQIGENLFDHSIDNFEINFRSPPDEYKEQKLLIINADEVKPDLH